MRPCPKPQIQIDGICTIPPEKCLSVPGIPWDLGVPFFDPFCVSENLCPAPSFVDENGICVRKGYELLVPLPCEEGKDCVSKEIKTIYPQEGLGNYLNIMLKIFIGICAVLAMGMIVLGGLEYMTSELVSSKESGKHKITGAILGLLLALGSYAILNTINPDLLNTDIKMEGIIVKVELEPETGVPSETIMLSSENGPITLKACDKSQMVIISAFGKQVEIYKGLEKSLKIISDRWSVLPENKRYPINSIGGYDCREVTNKPGFWSAHAFGLAVDINPNKNPYGQKLVEDMPPGFPGLFKTERWGWGGDWSSVKDPMHFSKYPLSEGGNGRVEF